MALRFAQLVAQLGDDLKVEVGAIAKPDLEWGCGYSIESCGGHRLRGVDIGAIFSQPD